MKKPDKWRLSGCEIKFEQTNATMFARVVFNFKYQMYEKKPKFLLFLW